MSYLLQRKAGDTLMVALAGLVLAGDLHVEINPAGDFVFHTRPLERTFCEAERAVHGGVQSCADGLVVTRENRMRFLEMERALGDVLHHWHVGKHVVEHRRLGAASIGVFLNGLLHMALLVSDFVNGLLVHGFAAFSVTWALAARERAAKLRPQGIGRWRRQRLGQLVLAAFTALVALLLLWVVSWQSHGRQTVGLVALAVLSADRRRYLSATLELDQ
ncbi:MAG: hypothetical protein OEZ06_15350 [Myxococcales bacterium]|nr:hypothetical protein [Myxococcales bacterium]